MSLVRNRVMTCRSCGARHSATSRGPSTARGAISNSAGPVTRATAFELSGRLESSQHLPVCGEFIVVAPRESARTVLDTGEPKETRHKELMSRTSQDERMEA